MISQFDTLPDFRLPDYSDAPLTLDGHPLNIYKEDIFSPDEDVVIKSASIPHGIATILYRWHPIALTAFLDLDAWFSLTWTTTLPPSTPDAGAKKLEIGRVGTVSYTHLTLPTKRIV